MFNLPVSKHTKSQKLETEWREWNEGRFTYAISATIRWDDQCGNGRNDFSITGTVKQKLANGRWREERGGCIHEDIATHFPEYAHLIKWHLASSKGPWGYPKGVLYDLSERDHNGLLKGEVKQAVTMVTKTPIWRIQAKHKTTDEVISLHRVETLITSFETPSFDYDFVVTPANIVGEGKERDEKGALHSAVQFPKGHPLHLSEADLLLPEDELLQLLNNRLVPMMLLFKQDLEAIGFTY